MEGVERFALLMDAQIMLSKEGCAINMGQSANYAAVKGVQIMPLMKECV